MYVTLQLFIIKHLNKVKENSLPNYRVVRLRGTLWMTFRDGNYTRAFIYLVGFELLTAVVMKSTIFCDITLHSLLSVNWHFGGTYLTATCFHAGFLLSLFFRPWRWRRYVSLKRRLILNRLHSVISQKMVLFIYISCLKIILTVKPQ
jgi:hypothetical protein